MSSIDPDMAWAAFERRDRSFDGRFVGAVRTTGIYCKPSCPARHPRREHVTFHPDGAAARAAGYRACLRCRPDEVARDATAVTRALAVLDARGAVALATLAAEVGYAQHHFHRLFKRATGTTPAAYARARRATRVTDTLTKEPTVTDAILEAGYEAPSRFYAVAAPRLGMTPSAWVRGGEGVTIRWTIVPTTLGPLLIAATARGLCRVSFDEDDAALAQRFPRARIEPGDAALDALASEVVAAVEDPSRGIDLPV
ncbi:MAG TPA: Ada metal-binding domain-containing protein, partial [Sphingomonas sp.]